MAGSARKFVAWFVTGPERSRESALSVVRAHVGRVVLVHLVQVGLVDLLGDRLRRRHRVVGRGRAHVEHVRSLREAGGLSAVGHRGGRSRDCTVAAWNTVPRGPCVRRTRIEGVEGIGVGREGRRRSGVARAVGSVLRRGLTVPGIDLEARRASSSVLTTHLQSSHHRSQPLIGGWISSGEARNTEVALRCVLGLRGLRHVRRVSWLQVGDGKANLLDQTTVCLRRDDLEFDQYPLGCIHIDGALLGVDEGAGQNLVDNSDTVNLISEDIREDVIVRRLEERLNDLCRRLRLHLLVDDPENSEGCQLVRAEMGQVGSEARGQQAVSRGEVRGVKEPCQQQSAVRVRGQRNGVQDDGSCDATLLADSNVRALETSPHTTSTEATLSNLPETVDHSLE